MVVDIQDSISYRDSAWVEYLPARGFIVLSFAKWPGPLAPGIYYVTAWTWRPGDYNPQNDTAQPTHAREYRTPESSGRRKGRRRRGCRDHPEEQNGLMVADGAATGRAFGVQVRSPWPIPPTPWLAETRTLRRTTSACRFDLP